MYVLDLSCHHVWLVFVRVPSFVLIDMEVSRGSTNDEHRLLFLL